MNTNRRRFLQSSCFAGGAFSLWSQSAKAAGTFGATASQVDEAAAQPVLKTEHFSSPVKIASVDLLQNGDQYFLRATSTDGAVGYAVTNNSHMKVLYPILLERVIPYFEGKDARELDRLIDGVFLTNSNYKYQGLALWICVASVEFALLDLLGMVAMKPVGELLGGVVRKDIGVYLANNYRGKSAVESARIIVENVNKYEPKAIKFKIGSRMSKNADYPPGRTEALIPLLREKLGDEMIIYTDSNGSYDVSEAIRIGKILQDHQIAFYEEPCRFDHLEETKQVADALEIPIAGGEQESSLHRFRWMIENNAVQIVQPDLFYFGGFVRSIRVARMAAQAQMLCTPHMSGSTLGYLYVLHFASCVPNAGQHMEYKGKKDRIPYSCATSSLELNEAGKIPVPTGPGLGVEIDPQYIKSSVRVTL